MVAPLAAEAPAPAPVKPEPAATGIRLYDRKTGAEQVFADPKEAQAAFQSGAFAPLRGAQLGMIGPDGKAGSVASRDLGQALDAGARFLSADELTARETDQRLSERNVERGLAKVAGEEKGRALAKLLRVAEAHQFGAARGATLGASDYLASKASPDAKQALADLKSAHPWHSGLAELGGATAASLASGGGGAGGTAARFLPAGGVEALGGMAERGMARIVGEGAGSLAGKVLQKAAPMAARGLAEGAAYGFGSELSEQALGDEGLNGEKLFAGAAHGALFGGLTGGALGTGGVLLREGGHAAIQFAAPKLEKMALEQGWHAMNPAQKFAKQAERAGGIEAVTRTAFDEGVLKGGADVVAMKETSAVRRAAVGDELGSMIARADEAGFKGPRIASVEERIEKGAIKELSEFAETNKGAISSVRALVTDFKKAMGEGEHSTFQAARDFRIKLQEQINFNKLDPRTTAWKAVRNAIEDELVDAGEIASKEMGGDFAKGYTGLKRKYQHLAIIDDVLEKAAERKTSNRQWGLTDSIAGAAGIAGGLATGGPLGAVAGFGLGLANKLARERGASTAAVALDKLAALSAIERQSAKVDREVRTSVEGFFKATSGKSAATSTAKVAANDNARSSALSLVKPKFRARFSSPQDEYEKRVDEIARAKVDPLQAHFAARMATKNLEPHAPKITAAMNETAVRASTFLASKMPPTRTNPNSALPQFEKPRISRAERDQFLDYARAVEDPMTVVRDFGDGRATREQVEALQIVYPKLYEQISKEVSTELAAQTSPPSIQKVVKLSLLLGRPLDDSEEPAFVKAVQAAGISSDAAPAAPPPTSKPLSLSKNLSTMNQRIEGK